MVRQVVSRQGAYPSGVRMINFGVRELALAFLLNFGVRELALAFESGSKLPHSKGEMVLIPEGKFMMGSRGEGGDEGILGVDVGVDQLPQREVFLKVFYIDKYEVTVQEYKEFAKATGHPLPGLLTGEMPENVKEWAVKYPPIEAHFPINDVTNMDAEAYCSWAGKRLPTEEEWEKAARGTDARCWPWGNVFDYNKANVGFRGTTPVNSHPEGVSPYGCYDMAGKVFELTDSWYELYPNSPENKIVARLLGEKYKVVRGGGYNADIGSARCADRGIKEIEGAGGPSLGFRCARDVPGYEHYRSAFELMNEAKNLKIQAEKDITPYEEHNSSRLLLKDAEGLLDKAFDSFRNENFKESEQLAEQGREKIKQAHQLALDFTKNKRAEKLASAKKVLTSLETLLKKIPDQLSPRQLEMKNKAFDHFKQSKQFFEEGSLGYAQMHAYIGLSIVNKITNEE